MLKKISLFSLILFIFILAGCQKLRQNDSFSVNLEQTWREKTIKSIDTLQQPLGLLRFSPDGQYLAVSSSSDGQLHIIDVKKQKIAYAKDLGIGRFTVAEYSPDSKYLYVGEQSPDGFLYCYSLADGRKIWQKRTADLLGYNLASKSYSSVNDIKLDSKGHLYFIGGRIFKQSSYKYNTIVYCLDAVSGRELWCFPKTGTMDVSSYLLATDNKGEKLIVNTNGLNAVQNTKYRLGSVYILDGKTGKLEKEVFFPTDKLFKNAVIWHNINITADAKRIGVFSNDGTAYLLDDDGQLIWQKRLTVPKKINEVLLHASGRKCYFVNGQVIFSTSNTSDLGKGRPDLALEHPNSNTIFAYDLKGRLLWKWKGGGLLNEQRFSRDGRYMVCSVANNCATKEPGVHGVYLLKIDEKQANLVREFHSAKKGPIIAADISADGRYIAGLEIPVLLEDNISVLGKYQVHIWKR